MSVGYAWTRPVGAAPYVPPPGGVQYDRGFVDDIGMGDTLIRGTARVRTVVDPVGVTDPRTVGQGALRALQDALGAVDAATHPAGGLARPQAATVALTDALARRLTRRVTDGLGALDTAGRTAATRRTPTDPLGTLDGRSQQRTRRIVDLLGLDDSLGGAAVPDSPAPRMDIDMTSALQAWLDSTGVDAVWQDGDYRVEAPLFSRVANQHWHSPGGDYNIWRLPLYQGTVTASQLAGFEDASAAWTVNQWGAPGTLNDPAISKWVLIVSGPGAGQAKGIIGNTPTRATIAEFPGPVDSSNGWAPAPVGGAYEIRTRTETITPSVVTATTLTIHAEDDLLVVDAHVGDEILFGGQRRLIASNTDTVVTLATPFATPIPQASPSSSKLAHLFDTTVLASGTVTTANNPTVTDSAATWTPGQYAGIALLELPNAGNAWDLAAIGSNTTDTLTLSNASRTPVLPPIGTTYLIIPNHDVPGQKAGSKQRNSYHLVLEADGVEIEGLGIYGHGGFRKFQPILEAQHAFNVKGISGFHIHHSRVKGIHGDGFSIYDDPVVSIVTAPTLPDWARFFEIDHMLLEDIGRQGININGGRDGWLHDNVWNRILRSLFDIEPNYTDEGGAVRILFEGELITTVTNLVLANANAKGIVQDITFRDCVGTDCGISGTFGSASVHPRERYTFERCISNRDQGGSGSGIGGARAVDGLYWLMNKQPGMQNRGDIEIIPGTSTDVVVHTDDLPQMQVFPIDAGFPCPIEVVGGTYTPVRYGTRWDKLYSPGSPTPRVPVDCGIYLAAGNVMKALPGQTVIISPALLTAGVPTVVLEGPVGALPGARIGGQAAVTSRTSIFGTVTITST